MTILSLFIALVVFGANTGIARADGWWKACDTDNDPGNGTQCGCQSSGSSSAASLGTGLGLTALVGYRIGRRRRR